MLRRQDAEHEAETRGAETCGRCDEGGCVYDLWRYGTGGHGIALAGVWDLVAIIRSYAMMDEMGLSDVDTIGDFRYPVPPYGWLLL